MGQWRAGGDTLLYTFNQDGTYKVHVKGDNGDLDLGGQWTYSGTKLRLVPKTISVSGAGAEAERKRLLKEAMDPHESLLEWQDNDHFSMKDNEAEAGLGFERKK